MTAMFRQRLEIRLRAIHCNPQAYVDKYPDDAVALCALVARKIQRCDWKNLADYTGHLRHLVAATDAYTDSTFCYIGTTQQEQYANMMRGTKARYPNLPGYGFHDKRHDVGAAIHIGYLGSDFHEHATSYLIAGLIEKHDRKKFKIHIFSCGADDHSPMRSRLKHAADAFIDLSAIKDYHAAAGIISSHNIDILVDLKGYTAGHSADIVASRPAPIIVSYLGWPGTTGGLCDYILADRIVIPECNRRFFSEKVVWLKGSYQVNDDKQRAGAALGRAEYGLPEAGRVFANFNQAYKITPLEWGAWMGKLQEYPDSVLWQYQVQPEALTNLRAEAGKYGIDAARIIPAKHINREGHLGRYLVPGLSLWDTHPVCGHTTSSDALRMGLVPARAASGGVLREVDSFISNVTRSLVANRDTLFDTASTARQIEEAYTIMWERHLDGHGLGHIEL